MDSGESERCGYTLLSARGTVKGHRRSRAESSGGDRGRVVNIESRRNEGPGGAVPSAEAIPGN
jgi:hypothetical protein